MEVFTEDRIYYKVQRRFRVSDTQWEWRDSNTLGMLGSAFWLDVCDSQYRISDYATAVSAFNQLTAGSVQLRLVKVMETRTNCVLQQSEAVAA